MCALGQNKGKDTDANFLDAFLFPHFDSTIQS